MLQSVGGLRCHHNCLCSHCHYQHLCRARRVSASTDARYSCCYSCSSDTGSQASNCAKWRELFSLPLASTLSRTMSTALVYSGLMTLGNVMISLLSHGSMTLSPWRSLTSSCNPMPSLSPYGTLSRISSATTRRVMQFNSKQNFVFCSRVTRPSQSPRRCRPTRLQRDTRSKLSSQANATSIALFSTNNEVTTRSDQSDGIHNNGGDGRNSNGRGSTGDSNGNGCWCKA